MNWFLLALLFGYTLSVKARSLSDSVYLEPFDKSAGGSVITRASREGILFGNPALLGLGSAWIRWTGIQSNFLLTGDLSEIRSALNSSSDISNDPAGATDTLSAIDGGFGSQFSLSFLNKNFGAAVFSDIGSYLRYSSFGDGGLPGIRVIADGIGGMVLSGAVSPLRWLHLGVSQKLLYGSYRDVFVTPVNITAASEELRGISSLGQSSATDIGMLVYLKGFTVDYSLGLVASNLSPVVFSSSSYPTLPSLKNIGLGLTIHDAINALHLSIDYNDIEGRSEEPLSSRIHAGARVLIWQTFGLAVGLMHNKVSYGIKFDVLFLKFGASYYHRKIRVGANGYLRPEICVTLSTGL